MKTKKQKKYLKLLSEFAKLQLAGNVPFWVSYICYAIFFSLFHFPEYLALATASIIANILFFIVDDQWVFANTKGRRKSRTEVLRFIIFIAFSSLLMYCITMGLLIYGNVDPYIGQFISAGLSSIWSFIGLRFWVFSPPHHHGLIAHKRKVRPRRRTA